MNVKVSDYIVKFLEKKKFSHVFGITGGGAMHLNNSFGNSSKMKFIFFHHEQSASMAAESYFRASNKPCLLHTTSGPGATNAITGVTGAWIDSIPMFIISGQVPTKDMINKTKTRQIGVQEINIIDLVKPITKYSKVVNEPEDIDIILNEAFEIMLEGKPGPVWIDVPLDIQSKFLNTKKIKIYKKNKHKKIPKFKLKDAQKLLKLLNFSSKPLLIIGNGIHISNTTKEFTSLFNKLKVPVISSWNSSDIINSQNNLYVGRMGIFGDRAANFAVEHSDLIIVIGSRLSIPQTGYDVTKFSPNSKKIILDISPEEINSKKFRNIALKLSCDLKFYMPFLDKFLRNKKIKKFNEWKNLLLDWKKNYPVTDTKNRNNSKYINSFDFIDKLSSKVSGNETIVTDMGTSFTCTMQTFKIKKPLSQRLFTSSGLAAMGYGLPGVIGAYFGNNKKKPICISGEGGLMFNIQELQTIKNYKIPLKLFILENKGYLTMKLMQKKNFNKFVGSDPVSGLSFPSFKKISETFGFKYHRLINNNIDIQLSKILSSKFPTVIEINMQPFQELIPRLQNRLNKDGSFLLSKFDDLYPHLPKKILDYERKRAREI